MPTSKGRHSIDTITPSFAMGVAISIAILGCQHATVGAKAEAAVGAWGVPQGVTGTARQGMLEAREARRSFHDTYTVFTCSSRIVLLVCIVELLVFASELHVDVFYAHVVLRW